MDSYTLTKSEIRKIYLAERKFFSIVELEEYSKTIFENFIKYFDLSQVEKVHCFLPIKKFKEINTQFFIDYFLKNSTEVYVPKVRGDEMISVRFQNQRDLKENSWGILEPESDIDSSHNTFDLIITPLLYCDKNGNRIGYGKGFYDKFFEKINSDALKIGVNIFEPNHRISDVSENDIKLDYLVTPTETLSFLAGISKFIK